MRSLALLLTVFLLGCGSRSTDYWISKAKAADSTERLHAIHELKDRPETDMVIPVLVDLLKDQDTFVRRDAAVALGELGEEARPAVPALLALRTDKETVRRAAADALDKIDSEAAASFRKPVRKK